MTTELIESIQQELPNVSSAQISNLMDYILTTEHALKSEHVGLSTWVPSRATVIKVLNSGVRVVDFQMCIETFKDIAIERKWPIEKNLDFKFISHVKILASSGQIQLEEQSK
ncbi:hypothetical protein [Gilvimarinus chinensis]|uniref:hypothetical protein n=1 Tax=Gilvimarinus chinensis TaxID=396005 RepID=UPI0003814413|nr:hypothetical protein [Gilvimarinus chinensis]